MTEQTSLWKSITEMRDRLARQEERAKHLEKTVEEMDQKLNRLVEMANKAEGAGKAALLFGKWGYGIAGVIGATIIANWQSVKKLF